jgi:hypothetical protein
LKRLDGGLNAERTIQIACLRAAHGAGRPAGSRLAQRYPGLKIRRLWGRCARLKKRPLAGQDTLQSTARPGPFRDGPQAAAVGQGLARQQAAG